MADPLEESDMPGLDEWIAEVGEDAVIAEIRETQRAVEAGELPSFGDAASLLQYWKQRRRQSA